MILLPLGESKLLASLNLARYSSDTKVDRQIDLVLVLYSSNALWILGNLGLRLKVL